MKMRKLGKLEVSEIGAGCRSISANYGSPADKNQGIAVIRAAHEKGVTFFDTAEMIDLPDECETRNVLSNLDVPLGGWWSSKSEQPRENRRR